jgi:DNA-binding CsgD family transcriptional regulator/tetratricopeptide (TPR) repeat protein
MTEGASRTDTERALPRLVGRDQELSRLVGSTHGLDGGAVVVLLEGEPGIGKSALLSEVRDAARLEGRIVLEAVGVEAEASLPFAALHQLLRPLQARISDLPAPQRDSLHASFGLAGGGADVFLSALATLTLLAEAGADAHVVAIVEDVHWLDAGSRAVFEFVLRRLGSEPVAVLMSARTGALGAGAFPGVERMSLGPLAPEHAEALVAERAAHLPWDVRRQVQEQSVGNPLALIELAVAASAADAGVRPASTEIPLTERLEQAFAARYRSLPESSKAVLLVAALSESESQAEVYAAASALTGTMMSDADLDVAVDGGLVVAERGRLTFRHPLVRSAIRQATLPGRLREAHRALASVIERVPDRHLWHLAAAVTEPDDDLADALAETADRVARQGDLGAAEAAYRRAAELSSDVEVRANRLLTAAELTASAGRTQAAEDLLARADDLDPGARTRARSDLLHEFLPHGALRVGRDIRPVMAALRTLADGGARESAIDALCRVASLAWSTGMGPDADRAVLDMARALSVEAHDPRMLHITAFADPLGSGAAVRAACRQFDTYALRSADLSALVAFALGPVGALDDAVPFLRTAVDGLRRRGALRLLVETYLFRAWNQIHRSRFRAAASSADESARLAVDIGEPLLALPARLAVAAADAPRGIVPDTAGLLPDTGGADDLWIRPFLAMAQVAFSSACLARGEYDEAYGHSRRLVDESDPAYHSEFLIIGFADHVEAAAASGRVPEARRVLERLEDRFAATDHDVVASGLALSRALVASVDDAEHHFRAALEPGAIRMPFVRARALLGFGRWLRRQRRIVEGRDVLNDARQEFERLELSRWAGKASAELRAAGVAVPAAPPDRHDELTPQERSIAMLAAEGLTNKQIGERMFLSHRTIGTHLYAIFPKLGIGSRDQIADALALQIEVGE